MWNLLPNSPPGQGSPAVLLDGDGCLLDPDVSNLLQPSSDSALDDHGGAAQPLGSQPLQKSHLTGSEKHFSLPKAVLVLVWNQLWQGSSTQGLGLIWVLRPTEQKAVPAEELLVRPPGGRRNRRFCSDSGISVWLQRCCSHRQQIYSCLSEANRVESEPRRSVPGRKACSTDADGLQHSAGSQLLHRPPGVKSEQTKAELNPTSCTAKERKGEKRRTEKPV